MDNYSTDKLVGLIEALDRPRTALLDMFFKSEQLFETEEIYFDKVNTARRLAPFVSPVVAGKAERVRGFQTSSFKPPYIKPKHAVDPTMTIKRRPGEKLTGEMSPQQRYDMIVAQCMEDQDRQIARREEWMASQILRTGAVTCASDDFPTMSVDFGRNAGHTVALTGGTRWGEANVVPTKSIRTWANLVHRNAGAHPGIVVMDPLAAELFLDDDSLANKLDNWRQRGGEMELFGAASGGQGEELVYLGKAGGFEYWQYSAIYTDDDGTVRNFMPDYTVIMGSPNMCEGIRTYGAILDKQALKAMKRFPKMWDVEDPSVTYAMTQSAPLPVLARADATFCATVR